MPAWIRFAADNLGRGEKILYQTQTHWIVIVWPAIWALLMQVATMITPVIDVSALKANPMDYLFNNPATLASVIVIPLALMAAFSLLGSILRVLTTEITITNQRILWKTGLVWRRTGELTRRVIEGNNVEQSVLGRILDYGTLNVNGIGNRTLRLTTIVQPMVFRQKLNRLIQATNQTPPANATSNTRHNAPSH